MWYNQIVKALDLSGFIIFETLGKRVLDLNANAKKKRRYNFGYDFVKVTGIIPAYIWIRPKIRRISKHVPKLVRGGVLIASNHPTFIDPVTVHLTFWNRRLYSIATRDLYKSKLREFFFNVTNCIMIDKENMSMRAMHEVCDMLKDGKAVVIFPEGAVNKTEQAVAGFKSGVILMAHMSKKPIVPMYIKKAARWYNRTEVVVGEPFEVSKILGDRPSMADIEKACAMLHGKEEELAEFCNKKR